MAKCPVCAGLVKTPSALNVDKWRWLMCPQCGAKLERKNSRWILPLISLYLCLLALGQLGHGWALTSFAILPLASILLIVMFLRPELQVRKPPKPKLP